MDTQLESLLESFKQELVDIYTTDNEAVLCVSSVWRGESATEYINALRMSGEYILEIIRRVEELHGKVNVFADSLSGTDTPI